MGSKADADPGGGGGKLKHPPLFVGWIGKFKVYSQLYPEPEYFTNLVLINAYIATENDWIKKNIRDPKAGPRTLPQMASCSQVRPSSIQPPPTTKK